MTGIYKVQRKHGVKWYAKVNYTIAGIHYQKKSPVFDSQKEAREAEIELQKWVRQVIQEAESGQADALADMPYEVTQRRAEARKRPRGSLRRPMGRYGKSTETPPKSKN